jgi:hypothetical protein
MVQNFKVYNIQVRIIENITKLNVPPNFYTAIISNENNLESLPVRLFMLYTRPTQWILPTLITDELVRSLSVISMQLALEHGKVVYDTNVKFTRSVLSSYKSLDAPVQHGKNNLLKGFGQLVP